jgi:hypothetical protein
MQLSLFKPANILPDKLTKVVNKIRNDLAKELTKPNLPDRTLKFTVYVNGDKSEVNREIYYVDPLTRRLLYDFDGSIKRQLFSCSNVRKTTHGNSKYS